MASAHVKVKIPLRHRTIWHQLCVRSCSASKCSESIVFCTLYIESLCADLLRTEWPVPTASTFLQPKPAYAGVRGHGCLLQRGESHSWPAAEECRDNGQKITRSQRQPLPFIIWYNWAVATLIWAPILLELVWLYWLDSHFNGQRIGLALLLGLLSCDNSPQGGQSRLWLHLAICLAPFVIPHLCFYRLSLAHLTQLQSPLSAIVMLHTSCQKYTSVSCHISLTWSFQFRFHWLKCRTRQKTIGHQQWAPLLNIVIKQPDGTGQCGSSWTPGTDVTDRHWAWCNTSHNRHNQLQLKVGVSPLFSAHRHLLFFMWPIKTSICIISP